MIKVRSIQLDVLYSVDGENGEPAKTAHLATQLNVFEWNGGKKKNFAAECQIIISFRLNLSASNDWPVHWKGKNRFSPNNACMCVCVCESLLAAIFECKLFNWPAWRYCSCNKISLLRPLIYICVRLNWMAEWNEKLKEKCNNTQITTAAHVGSQANAANKWKWKGNREWAVKQCVITIGSVFVFIHGFPSIHIYQSIYTHFARNCGTKTPAHRAACCARGSARCRWERVAY